MLTKQLGEDGDGEATQRAGTQRLDAGIVSVGLFMVVLDNLVVSVALPSIHARPRRVDPAARVDGQRLHPDLRRAAPDRRGARRPLRPPADVHRRHRALHRSPRPAPRSPRASDPLIAARAVQGAGAAIVTPLTLTLLADGLPGRPARHGARRLVGHQRHRGRARPARRRRRRRGGSPGTGSSGSTSRSAWSSCRWPALRLAESRGPTRTLDLPGLGARLHRAVRARLRPRPQPVAGLDAARPCSSRWPPAPSCSSPSRLRARGPRRRCCRWSSSPAAGFAVTNAVSLAMYFGMFGSIFFLSQFLQNVLGNSPAAGRASSCWSGPARRWSSRRSPASSPSAIGSRLFMVAGLALQAVALGWLALDGQRRRRPTRADRRS